MSANELRGAWAYYPDNLPNRKEKGKSESSETVDTTALKQIVKDAVREALEEQAQRHAECIAMYHGMLAANQEARVRDERRAIEERRLRSRVRVKR